MSLRHVADGEALQFSHVSHDCIHGATTCVNRTTARARCHAELSVGTLELHGRRGDQVRAARHLELRQCPAGGRVFACTSRQDRDIAEKSALGTKARMQYEDALRELQAGILEQSLALASLNERLAQLRTQLLRQSLPCCSHRPELRRYCDQQCCVLVC